MNDTTLTPYWRIDAREEYARIIGQATIQNIEVDSTEVTRVAESLCQGNTVRKADVWQAVDRVLNVAGLPICPTV